MKTSWILRTTATLLCTLMLTAAMAACNKENPDTTTTESGNATTTAPAPEVQSVKLAVEEYTLIRPDMAAQSTIDAAVLFNKAVMEKTGKNFKGFTDDFVKDESLIDDNAYEILIGATNRPQSAQALEGVSYGYVIKQIGNKIVINATVSSLVPDAVTYFIEHYINASTGDGIIAIPEQLSISQASEGSLTLLDDKKKSNFKLVFADELDNTSSSSNEKDRTDYVVKEALAFRTAIMTTFKDVNLPLGTDWVKRGQEPDSTSYEILVGITNRSETKQFLDSLNYNEYGFAVIGNKIVVAGWSDYTTDLALNLLEKKMSDYTFTDANGNKNMIMSSNTRVVEAYQEWNTNFPKYEGGVFSGVMEGFDTCYEVYYTETTVDAYNAYRAKLEAEGFKLHQENKIADNLFATYYNNEIMVHAYYVDYLKSVRIVTEQLKTTALPQNEDPYTKVTDTTFTMMDLDNDAGNFGNAFIITLEDGSFIIHDGGADAGGKDKAELYNLLQKLNKRQDGKIVIAAWIVSHEHWDHFKNFYDLVSSYSRSVTLERVVYNAATPSINYNSNNPGSYVKSNYLKQIQGATKCELVKFHTGQTIQLRNLKVECIYTQEDIYPQKLHTFNNSSMPTRFTIDGQRFTILGDIQSQASDIMVKMYGHELKTDILQVAHHGYDGGTTELYSFFRPTVLMWPTDDAAFANQTAGTSSNAAYKVDYALYKQPNVKLVVLADNGHKTVKLPITDFTDKSVIVTPVTRK